MALSSPEYNSRELLFHRQRITDEEGVQVSPIVSRQAVGASLSFAWK